MSAGGPRRSGSTDCARDVFAGNAFVLCRNISQVAHSIRSVQVAPVSELLSHIPHRVPQVLINRDPVPHVMDTVDVVLLGDCDEIVAWLEQQLRMKSDSPTPTFSTSKSPIESAALLASPTFSPHPLSNGTDNGSELQQTQEEPPWKGQEPVLAMEGIENVWCFEDANTEHIWMRNKRGESVTEEQDDEHVGTEIILGRLEAKFNEPPTPSRGSEEALRREVTE